MLTTYPHILLKIEIAKCAKPLQIYCIQFIEFYNSFYSITKYAIKSPIKLIEKLIITLWDIKGIIKIKMTLKLSCVILNLMQFKNIDSQTGKMI